MTREKQADKIKRLENALAKAQSDDNCLQHIIRQRVVLPNTHEAVTVVRGPRTSAWIVLTAPSDDQPGPRVTGIIPIWDLALMRQVRASLDESVQVAMHWTMNPTSDADRRERNDEVERRANLREEYDRAMRELGVTS